MPTGNRLPGLETGHVKITDFGFATPIPEVLTTPQQVCLFFCHRGVALTRDTAAPALRVKKLTLCVAHLITSHRKSSSRLVRFDSTRVASRFSCPYRPLSVAAGHSFQADFWALGVTVYEMLTGKTPFATRGGGFATYRKVRARNLCCGNEVLSHHPGQLVRSCHKALGDRWRVSCTALMRARVRR